MLSQYQVLNYALNQGNFKFISENNLTAGYFFNYTNEYNFIKHHLDTYGNVPDDTTLIAAFPDFQRIEVKEPETYLLSEIKKDYNTNYLSTTFNKMKKLLENDKTHEAENFFLSAVKDFQPSNISGIATSIIHDTSRYENYLKRAENHDEYFTSTGFKELDEIIGGIDKKEENMVIAARTGIGKSWMLDIMAAACYTNGMRVGIYSGEMSVEKVAYRIDTMLGNKNAVRFTNRDITRGNLWSNEGYKAYIDELGKVPKDQHADILIFTPNDIAGPATVDALAAYIKDYKFDILMIDQYSLLEDLGKYQKESDRIAHISKEVKTKLQVSCGIPIVSVSQNNRTGDKDDDGSVIQDTTQIAGSDRIGQDATVILMLSRKQIDEKQDQFIINVVKARDGGTGRKLTYAADFNIGKFNYVSENLSKEEAKVVKDKFTQGSNNEYATENNTYFQATYR